MCFNGICRLVRLGRGEDEVDAEAELLEDDGEEVIINYDISYY